MDIMSKKWWYFILSTLIIIPGIISLFLFKLNLGVDFIGGNLFEYRFEKPPSEEEVRGKFHNQQIEVSSLVKSRDNTYLIRTKEVPQEKVSQLKKALEVDFGKVEEVRIESIGPVIGAETTQKAITAVIVASVVIVLYLSWAFRKVPKPTSSLRFGMTAVAALLHDVLVLLGIFSLLGHFYKVEIDVLFITAMLTVIGFSVHDTIVVFDRIRENLPKHLSKSFTEVANISVVQTLARSLNTTLTVVFVLLALLLFGGETIKWFVVALLIGIISGTYSSIFNATVLLALWEEELGH